MTRVRWFFSNPKTGELVIAQLPNAPAIAWVVATVLRWRLVATAALVVWAVLEIVRGESPFRRVLGAVVLVAGVASRVR